jgi:hypothetical protein
VRLTPFNLVMCTAISKNNAASILLAEENIYKTTRYHIWEDITLYCLPSFIYLNYLHRTQCSAYMKRHLEWKLIITNAKCSPPKYGCSRPNWYHDPTVNIRRVYPDMNNITLRRVHLWENQPSEFNYVLPVVTET